MGCHSSSYAFKGRSVNTFGNIVLVFIHLHHCIMFGFLADEIKGGGKKHHVHLGKNFINKTRRQSTAQASMAQQPTLPRCQSLKVPRV